MVTRTGAVVTAAIPTAMAARNKLQSKNPAETGAIR